MIVAFSAGGSNDVVARIVSPELSWVLPHPLVVENLMGSASTLASNLSMSRNLPHNAVRGFAPIMLVAPPRARSAATTC